MKLRIQGNSIRLRLSQSEVARFHQAGSVSDGISFGEGASTRLTYTLERTDGPKISAEFADGTIRVLVPAALCDHWATSEQEVGMEHLPSSSASQHDLRILVEKDFKCLADRPGEDESDNFPNPNVVC